MIKDVTDLEVYNQALELIPKLYFLLNKLPLSERDLTYQGKRAGKAIPPNIAEGFAKRYSDKEFRRYLMIALASSDEVITHLRIVKIVLPELAIEADDLASEYRILSKRINTLHKNWVFRGIK